MTNGTRLSFFKRKALTNLENKMTTPFKRKTLPLLIATLALTMSGCGKGGGDNPATGDTGITGVTLDGTAAKGIINKGNVLAEELNSSGAVIRAVGNATTGADGSYEIPVASSYEGGPIQVTITADSNTEMKCDIPASSGCGTRTDGITDTNSTVDFGEWYKPGELTMTALVPEAATSDKVKVNITPYTDLAARRAKASGTVNNTAVYNANSEVSNLLGGIDILNTKPLDITDSTVANNGGASERAYAAFGAAIASLADSSSGKPNLNDALSTLLTSFADGKISANDTLSSNFSLQELITAATGTFTKAGIADTSGVITTLQSNVDTAVNGIVDPAPSTTAGSTALTKVKTFVGDVRTWGTVIDAEIKVKGDAFDQQTSLAYDASDMSLNFLVSPALEAALKALSANAKGTHGNGELSGYGLNFDSGTINKSNDVITITNGVIGGVTVNMSASAPAEGATISSSITIGITSATFRSAAADADINKGTVVLNLISSYIIDYAAIEAGTAAFPDISGASIDLDISLTQKQNGSGEALSAQVTFAGALSTSLTNPSKGAATLGDFKWITPSTLTLGGKISSSAGHSMEATFTANITNASTFTPVGELLVGSVTHDLVTWTNTDTDGVSGDDSFTLTNPGYSFTVYWDSVTGLANVNHTYGYGITPSSTFSSSTFSSFAEARANLTPSYMYASTDQGTYYVDLSLANFSTNGTASGALLSPKFIIEGVEANQWLDATVGLNFGLQLEGLPKASINITGDRTGIKNGTATITIAYGTRQIVINGTITDGDATGNNVEITNQDGVKMTIIPDVNNKTGTLQFNGATYGTIEELSNGLVKITYTDGTFETL